MDSRFSALDQLPPARFSTLNRIWMVVLRAYLVIAVGLVLFRIFPARDDGCVMNNTALGNVRR